MNDGGPQTGAYGLFKALSKLADLATIDYLQWPAKALRITSSKLTQLSCLCIIAICTDVRKGGRMGSMQDNEILMPARCLMSYLGCFYGLFD